MLSCAEPECARTRILQSNYAPTIRDWLHKLVCYHDRAAGELFDLEVDPAEFDNL